VQRLPRRPLVLAARATVLLAMAAGTVGYTVADKTVTISADGRVRTVHTFAGDVASVLHRAGLSVGPHDVVAPGLDESLHDGSRIVIERAQPLVLGQRLAGAYLSASRSRAIPVNGLALTVRMPQQVSLVVGGAASTVTTTAATVAELLTEAGVVLNPYDVVSVPLDSYPASGAPLTVTRVTRTQWLQRNKIAIPTQRVLDPHLTVGKVELAHNGKAGTYYRLWGIIKVDGHVVTQKMLQQRTVVAKPKVLLYGTKPKPKPVAIKTVVAKPVTHHTVHQSVSVPKTSKGAGLNWAALAQCESGGNPRSVDGPYYGLYQFTLGTWASVGGRGRPSDASAAEQTYRAKLLYAQQGRSPWPSCGHNL
jgi:resuscitation-promoting factor RpfB